jgi:cellobiose phosphorylase
MTRRLELPNLGRMRAWLRRRGSLRRRAVVPEPTLRATLYSADQMERHGQSLAAMHRLGPPKPGVELLLARLADNDALLTDASRQLAEASAEGRRISPAGEWLLDNFYLVEEQVRIAQRHLPRGYSRELPRLARGPSAGLPRVYDIALEAIAHGDGRIDAEGLRRFVAAYQSVSPLKLGELWAVPIMLRLALIENLRRVAARVISERRDRALAAHWAGRMMDMAENEPRNVVLEVADMARSEPPMSSAFVAEFTRKLQGQSVALALPLAWIEQWLAESGHSIEYLVQQEAQQQAADQVSIGNSIGSLRELSAIDWREFVEDMSLVEQALRSDPAGVYARMDFGSRDRYRHAVESLARRSERSEPEVARAALELARAGMHEDADPRLRHVGHYLVDRGQPALEEAVQARAPAALRLRRAAARVPLLLYLGPIALLTVAFAWPLFAAARAQHIHGWPLALLALALLLAASQLAQALVNQFAGLWVAPSLLPRLDFSKGIPVEARTLVVVPTLLGDEAGVDALVEGLEVRYLANRGANLYFGLLGDFHDAAQETLPGDEALLERAARGIEELNRRYAAEDEDRFFLFHRPRRWNERERRWMGHERKRGKLSELNALLRGHGWERFSRVVGDIGVLAGVRYVITLDTDTLLPRDSAYELVGTMEHPLNRPRRDAATGLVCGGYGILQPRVGISLSSGPRSGYARLFGGDAGVDPYTRAVSDLYQDAFAEGSFIGKGIYDVDAFEGALAGRFPDNAILSHDLVEGCHARSGLVSDVQLYEDYPSTYRSDTSRRERWIRGDWQLLPWLLPWAPNAQGRWQRNPISTLSRWKMFDNLRRSLVAPALLGLLLAAWFALRAPLAWTLALLAVPLLPVLSASLQELLSKPRELRLRSHLHLAWEALVRQLARAALFVSWLPHEAWVATRAIARTLWRMLVSRRGLLEWQSSSVVERAGGDDHASNWRRMAIAPALALAVALGLAWQRPEALPAALPLLLLWLAAPSLAWWSGRPAGADLRAAALGPGQQRELRRLARKTWAFFERHVGEADNWLPPDNLQEVPAPTVAHRTSPTNLGLALLANLAAYDFGYLGGGELLVRGGNTLRAMDKLERHRGHFLNWYDTQTLRPLPPRYISSVDSGNLAGHLLVLRAGLLALADAPLLHPRIGEGLLDTLAVLEPLFGHLPAEVAALREQLAEASSSPEQAQTLLQRTRAFAEQLRADAAAAGNSAGEDWAQALARQCDSHLKDLELLLPWLWPDAGSGVVAPADLRTLAAFELDSLPEVQREAMAPARALARRRLAEIEAQAELAGEYAQMQYQFLYDRSRHLLSIGYNLDERRLDASFYDLLASESRLASFVAIAQGQLPQEGWFALGRLLTVTGAGEPVLLSWSGSMFEYLMPTLVMPGFTGSLLDQTCAAAVARQIAYGAERGVPWGVSESAYNVVDVHLTYQYRAFGVPGLGLKRGLSEDIVVAPYASALALLVAPAAAAQNLRRLSEEGAEGAFGLYEAIDYTQARLPRGQERALIRSYMAHHQGMSLLAFAHALLDRPMQKRFESDPQFQATMLLLQERVPRTAVQYLHATELPALDAGTRQAETKLRVLTDPDTARPAVQLLSNGRYHVMQTSAGGGYSRWRDLAVTRWQEDAASDHRGTFLYIRDVEEGEFWSNAYQPSLRKPAGYEAIFSDARVEYRGREQDIEMHAEIVVSPEDDIELRRTTIRNRARVRRTIEVTSYAEVVLAPAVADALHPAFGKLFVQTELVRDLQAILATRRPRSEGEFVPWMCHLMAVHEAEAGPASYETDRARFLGRGNTAAKPAAMTVERLSDSEGSVLDPVVAIRVRIVLEPEQSAVIDVVTGMAETREQCLALVEKYRDRRLADRVFDLAWTHSQVLLRQLNSTPAEAQLYERLAGSVLYATPALRADAGTLARNRRGQSGLWGQSVSGDLPIVLLQIADGANIELARQVVQAHAYWRLKGLAVDLVIWNEDRAGYRQHLQDLVMGLVAGGMEAGLIDKPGGIFVRPAHQISSEDRVLMQAVARVVLSDDKGTLAEQVGRRPLETPPPRALELEPRRHETVVLGESAQDIALREGLQLRNDYGGFSADGSEYVIRLAQGQVTPAPWCNVLANPWFGTVVSESGGAYTWGENAHEFRLTPWHNDPVSDGSGEAFWIRDEESGRYWSPTPMPARGQGRYTTRHGFGYSVYEHSEDGLLTELWVYVALDASVKFSVLKVRNLSGRARRLSLTGYVEWVLGDLRPKQAMHVVTESDAASGALLARNAFNMEFPGRVAFFDVDSDEANSSRSATGDRIEFLGRNRTLRNPAALGRTRLSGRLGAGMDPCGALQVAFELEDGESRETVFRLGLGRDLSDARTLIQRFRAGGAAAQALQKVREHWSATLGAVQVHTPDPALDVLANGWLLYQTIACRFWARSGFYQSGGAYGFRDQLQDSMAMLHADPARVRAHLLLCAAHQFPEGDVQHWWHPPLDRGVRTRCSDDFLWLPLAVARYLAVTGDAAVLDETVPFVEGRPVNMDEEGYYDLPVRSAQRESLYGHCLRALARAQPRGVHGLPLIGCGDWNDGMNLVGEHGRGESVWLGFFLHEVLRRFEPVARARGDADSAERLLAEAAQLREALATGAWDGEWFRRAYFDDGTPLGSTGNAECRIDSIAQSWSVLSGAAEPERARQAMASLDRWLVKREAGLVQLLDPPFDHMRPSPGYIQGYVPGVRENGGQYTHAAVWAAMAFAELGDARAWELFELINPVRHGSNAEALAAYKVEPYVVAADVYGVEPHVGRGGWTWYTGSAGWMYRLLTESLLGLRVENGRLHVKPLLRPGWTGYRIVYRYGASRYRIQVQLAEADMPARLLLDGVATEGGIALVDDGAEHEVLALLPPA